MSLDFSRRWAAVREEYAVRYGEKVKGWWIDGKFMRDYVRKVNEAGGVVTVDIYIDKDSSYDPAQLAVLAEIGL